MLWTPLGGIDLEQIAARLTRGLRPGEALEAEIFTPSWYENGSIVEIRIGDQRRSYIAAGLGEIGSRQFFLLDGTLDPFIAGNQAACVHIRTREDAAEYTRFHFSSLSYVTDIGLTVIDGMPSGLTVDSGQRHVIRPLSFAASREEGLFVARVFLEGGGQLFDVLTLVRANGSLEICSEIHLGAITRLH